MHPLTKSIQQSLAALADPVRAVGAQAYLKTDQPLYGVQSAQRKKIFREAKRLHPLTTRDEYEQVVRELWYGVYREEMYQAIEVAEGFRQFHDEESWALYYEMISTATNWDTLDWLACRVVGPLVRTNRKLEKDLVRWSHSDNMWVRRASLLAHLKHKSETNTELLSATILLLTQEKEFFIRKAIGWILRDYSYTDSEWVQRFVNEHQDLLSNLSKREALKQINRRG